MDCGDDRKEGQQRVMGVVLGVHSIGDHRSLADKGVSKEVAGNNHVMCSIEINI